MKDMPVVKLCFLALVTALLSMVATTGTASANSKYAALVIHADTGDILFDRYSTQKRYPASLTKMMTLYLLFEQLEEGKVTLETKLTVSRNAASMPASKLGIDAGETITVEDAIHALVIKSANDIAVVVAEKIGGSETRFAQLMTEKAWAMGMRSTTFRNASGLPNSSQITTARDLATLSQRVVQDFPQYYHYFSDTSFEWDGKTIKGHNNLLGKYDGADGLKTGYTRLSGYNLATTAVRGDERLIGIVLGGRSSYTRDAHMISILNDAYSAIKDKPELLSALRREPPSPNLKPTTLAKLGGTWPKEDGDGEERDTLQVLARADNAAIKGTPALQAEIAAAIADGNWKDEDGLPIGDDLKALIAASNGKQTQLASRDDGVVGEGDIDYDTLLKQRQWTIQTGAYRDVDLASTEMSNAKLVVASIAPIALNELSETESAGKPIYRIRFNGLTETEARAACKAVIDNGGDCFTLRNPALSGT